MSKTLDRLQAVERAASERPWKFREQDYGDGSHSWHMDTGSWSSAVIVYGNEAENWEAEGRANAELIRVAVNTYPEALAVVRAAAAALARYEAVLPYIHQADTMNFIHGGRYDGPEGGLPVVMDPLRAALAAFDEAATRSLS